MSNLKDLFPHAEVLKTKAGAQRRLDRFVPTDVAGIRTAVIDARGGYLPVAILTGEGRTWAGVLAQSGICVHG